MYFDRNTSLIVKLKSKYFSMHYIIELKNASQSKNKHTIHEQNLQLLHYPKTKSTIEC